ncbi:MAG: hypothetical protein GWP91_16445, partial [Rhodobacterales bacterium]|nr:hypothetical protein [Rhodobacterales bacterium]
MHRCLPLLAIALSACAPTVMPLYEEARLQALAQPGPLPEAWRPDAVVHLSETLLTHALDVLLASEGTLTEAIDIGLVTATPTLKVSKLQLRKAKCATCLGVDATLKGNVVIDSPVGAHKTKVTATLSFDAEFEVEASEEHWVLTVAPRQVEKVKLTLNGAGV